jgi:hypothetical protein
VKEKRYVNAIIGLGVSIFLLGASTIGTTPKTDSLKESDKDNTFTSSIKTTHESLIEKSEEMIVSGQQVKLGAGVSTVYDDMTLEQLAEKIERNLNSTLTGKGYLIASYSLQQGVDPYLALAIMLHETGCAWSCSTLTQVNHNVGGMRGSNGYLYFATIDEGIKAFIDNLSRNYVRYGLTTAETMNSKYAENPNWHVAVNRYIEQIKAS